IVDAEDGLSGIEAAIREQPDLILLDINLPGVDGYEVASIIKSFSAIATTPIIALTAYAMEGDRQRTLVAGCDGYIQKPIDVDTFPSQVGEFLHGKRERLEEREEGIYLRELNQRLVYRLVNQVEELKRLNQHFVRRAGQLAELHRAVQDITSELGVTDLLEKLLPQLARALGTTSLAVELSDPPGVRVAVAGDGADRPRSVLSGAVETVEDWVDLDWSLPLVARGRQVGTMAAHHRLPPGAKADEEQLLNIVANQVAIAVENSRLFDRVTHRAAEQETLVAAGRLLTGTLQVAEVLGRLAELVRNRLDGVVRIWLRDPATGELSLSAQAGETRTKGDDAAAPARVLARFVLDQRAPLVVADLRADERVGRLEWVEAEGFVAFLGIPLFLEDEAVGILSVLSRQPRTFWPDELAFAEALATSAAAAIRNARSYEETQQQLRRTETFLSVSQAVGSTLDLAEMMRRVAKATASALGADMVGAYLADDDRQFLRPIAGYRVPEHLRDNVPVTLRGHRFLEEAWTTKKAAISTDSPTDPRIDAAALARFPHRSVVFVPMTVKGEPIGGLFAIWWQRQYAPDHEELRLVDGIASQAAIAIENSRLYEGLKRQMAELRQTQAQLIQSTKLAAIGELAANIAHEINNPLTTVLGFASFLTERLEPGAPTLEELKLIQEEATRARDIVRDLLQFSRQNEFLPAMSDVNVVVEQVVSMVRRQGAVDAIDVQEAYAPDLPLVEMDVSRMKQVFLNIVNNAIYAMPEGGALRVRTSARDGFLHVEFTDTGTGIDADSLPRIFDPFFTTKPDVSGTGLGLSVSLGIVQSHGGTIEVGSTLGKGSTFTVKLPIEKTALPVAD
ncbi:MAG: GAF domain-containing protein, partial [Candidatus Rokubacteria bacterium]|nr:GAF domain-containing protein [Candidatus Rokubacteria bacterium]